VVPIAVEYTFWTESKPEALVRPGSPLPLAGEGSGVRGKERTHQIETALTASLDVLNAETATRDPAKFTELLGGTVGVGGVYDAFRRSVAFVSGTKFDPSHMATAEKPA
jgi:hypothetical protein